MKEERLAFKQMEEMTKLKTEENKKMWLAKLAKMKI